jgi:[ribosomal protein S18]-alanine N-acetyltransferase
MSTASRVRLANPADATDIAAMSRDYVEQGLQWRWKYDRVLEAIANPDTNVAVVGSPGSLVAFGIMSYVDDNAHLELLAVRRSSQRRGIGTAVLLWLEQVVRSAGAARVLIEVRKGNSVARSFYSEHGYDERYVKEAMYSDIEDGIGLEKQLRVDA